MRFSDRITFVEETETHYDPREGRYVEGELIETIKPCNLTTLSTERTSQLFGSINQKITVARLQRPYNEPFDYVLIDEERYKVTRQSDYRKGVFYLESEVDGT